MHTVTSKKFSYPNRRCPINLSQTGIFSSKTISMKDTLRKLAIQIVFTVCWGGTPKLATKKGRQENRTYLLDGWHLVEEAIKAKAKFHAVMATEAQMAEHLNDVFQKS